MNHAIILAAGVGQRMRNGGLPKQFLKLQGKPIIIYTLEKFANMADIDRIIIPCHGAYVEYMEELLEMYHIHKVERVISGGNDRQGSLRRGLEAIYQAGASDEDIVIVHDGVRPLISEAVVRENIRIAKQHGCAITVHPVTESVVVTADEKAGIDDFKKRAETYTMTAPQTFRFGILAKTFSSSNTEEYKGMPLLDAAMLYAAGGGRPHLVKEQNVNLKVTTPEDFYILRAMLELEENKFIFGL